MKVFEIEIPAGDVTLEGVVHLPGQATGIVLFAHGSGSSRHSPRNRFVAGVLNEGGVATLLFDLLTLEEEGIDMRTATLRFDIGLLACRLVGATDWAVRQPDLQGLRIGYFGSSTGGAAALIAAAERPANTGAVVCRGSRTDLATPDLPRVQAPTLFIVGGYDATVLALNRESFELLRCEKELEVVPGATHLFAEPGTLERVAHS